MSSKAEMECGTSLAEDAWAVPSVAAAAASSDVGEEAAAGGRDRPSSSSVEDAWARIRALRSRLADDVVRDPRPPSSPVGDGGLAGGLPTFVSPFERPAGPGGGGKKAAHRPYKGMDVPLIYCDQTASNRPVRSVEEYLRRTTMPCHANTHTDVLRGCQLLGSLRAPSTRVNDLISIVRRRYPKNAQNITYTGSQSTAFVSEARQIVGEAVNARTTGKAALDAVIFGGNGVTGAVAILVDCLNLRGIAEEARRGGGAEESRRPVVFVGPHEHHSNLIPWRESGCEVVAVPERPSDGMVDVDELERLLRLPQYAASSARLRIGAFSAASNVTGLIADVDRIAIVLHRHGALAFFDYASGAPYLPVNMNPNPVNFSGMNDGGDGGGQPADPSKDAIYFSPHKCYGGPSTPGVLVIKKRLISQTNPPATSGGGTVFYVTNEDHRFLSNRIERYEGGTPDGIGVQRVGLALLAGRRVANEYERIARSAIAAGEGGIDNTTTERLPILPPKTLLEFECSTYDRVVGELERNAPNLVVLGKENNAASGTLPSSCVGRHLPVFSFLIRCGRRFLHYNFVCALLNDLFGIQSRGGCQCAGPYSQRLLGLTTIANSSEVPNDFNRGVERALLRSDRPCELLRPGYTRLSLPFKGLRDSEVEYVVRALIWVAKNGWALLPQYRCDHRTGDWRHWSRQGKPLGKSERRWLSHYDILSPTEETKNDQGPDGEDISILSPDMAKFSRACLDETMTNVDLILEQAKRDPRFRSEVEKMNAANGMLGSGSSGDAGEGGVDDTLEDLRWYAYPQEVSQCLRDGLDGVPATFVDDALLGAIHIRMDGKRKATSEADQSVQVDSLGGDSSLNTSQSNGRGISDLFQFQEGDHVGEASFDEIKSGYEDGELGDTCKVFCQKRDEWLSIEEFLRGYDEKAETFAPVDEEASSCRKRDLKAMKGDSPSFEQGISSIKIGSAVSERKQQPKSYLHLAAEKREKKKPSRDSSQWGQCALPHIASVSNSSTAPSSHDLGSGVESVMSSQINANGTEEVSPVVHKLSNKNRKNKGKLKPPPKMMRFITQAMIQWDMIQEGDRLLLGLSGGKDSLSLLHCLLEFQRKLPIKFEIEVCTIDPMTPSFDPSPLIPYVEGLGLKYHYIRDDIVARANTSGKNGQTVSSLCAFCARMKRGNLYTCARQNTCNKLVLAQHLDDLAESFLMSVMHNGFIRTMKANYQINAGDVSVIRPLVYCRENLMTEFAKSANLPVINENCPACFEEPKERARIKKLLSREETLNPNLYDHIRRALIPVMHDDSTSIMRSYLEDTIAKSRKVPGKSKKVKTASASKEMDMNSMAPAESTLSCNTSRNGSLTLESATEEELIAELARRRAAKYKLSGAMKQLSSGDGPNGSTIAPEDATGQMCTLSGGNGTIPCRELME
ncbi:hypothetical protein ACHAWF_016393 [Thalassiosira exigua]